MGAISDKYTGATAVLTPKHNRNIEDFKLTTFTGTAWKAIIITQLMCKFHVQCLNAHNNDQIVKKDLWQK